MGWLRLHFRPDIGYGAGRIGQGFASELTLAVSTVFMLQRGLSFGQIGLVSAVFLTVSCVLNIPTGAWADQAGRRRINSIGLIFLGLGQFGYGLSHHSLSFVAAAALYGIGTAAAGGALQAWLVDEQIALDQRSSVKRIMANTAALTAVAGIGAALLVGLAFRGPLHHIYFTSGGVYVATGLALLLLLRENFGSGVNRLQIMKESVRFYLSSTPLLLATCVMTAMYASFMAFIFTWQPQSLTVGLQTTRLGLLYAGYLACLAAGSYGAGRIAGTHTYVPALLMSLIVAVGGLAVLITGQLLPTVALGIALFAIGYGAFIPTIAAWINEFTRSDIRASVLSVINMVALGLSAAIQLSMGVAIDHFGFGAALAFSVGMSAAAIVLLLIGFAGRRSQQPV